MNVHLIPPHAGEKAGAEKEKPDPFRHSIRQGVRMEQVEERAMGGGVLRKCPVDIFSERAGLQGERSESDSSYNNHIGAINPIVVSKLLFPVGCFMGRRSVPQQIMYHRC